MDPAATQDSAAPSVGRHESNRATLGLRRRDQLFVGVCIIAGLLFLGIHAYRLGAWGQAPIEIERLPARQYDYKLDVNRATWIEWTLLEGIGEKLAHRIVADREENGPFASIEDVRRVKGIGPKTWEDIRPHLMMGSNSPAKSDSP